MFQDFDIRISTKVQKNLNSNMRLRNALNIKLPTKTGKRSAAFQICLKRVL